MANDIRCDKCSVCGQTVSKQQTVQVYKEFLLELGDRPDRFFIHLPNEIQHCCCLDHQKKHLQAYIQNGNDLFLLQLYKKELPKVKKALRNENYDQLSEHSKLMEGLNMSDEKKPDVLEQRAPRVLSIAQQGVRTTLDFKVMMSGLMSDVIEGSITPQVGNAVVNAGGKLLKVVELEQRFGKNTPDGKALDLLGPPSSFEPEKIEDKKD